MVQAKALLRTLPQVDEVLRRAEVAPLVETGPRWAVAEAVRKAIAERRRAILDGATAVLPITVDELQRSVASLTRRSLERVINATGVVLHTNLGRAPLATQALDRLRELAAGYVNLEYDVEAGERGSRHHHAAGLLAELCGAEAALVVNNGAAAIMLALATLAHGRAAIVSRGELVEIGGAFRVPDILVTSGAALTEVGTTNRTRLADYETAIDERTALLLKVHRSNFAVVGFTEETSVAELGELGRERGLPLVYDVGSGALVRLSTLGLDADEPTVQQAIRDGADLVTCSGDKLLGGPQAGILVGKRALIEACARHPLMRVVRPSRLTFAALTATLELYRDHREQEIPVLARLAATEDELKARAERLCKELRDRKTSVVWKERRLRSAVGGGSMPLCEPWSWGIAVEVAGKSASELAGDLRRLSPPIVGRIEDDEVLIDLRSVAFDEEQFLVQALLNLR